MIGVQIRKACRQVRGIRQAALLQVPQAGERSACQFQVLRDAAQLAPPRPSQVLSTQRATELSLRTRKAASSVERSRRQRAWPSSLSCAQNGLVGQCVPHQRRGAGNPQQVGEGHAGPRRAQHRQPRRAIAEMQQRASQHNDVAHGRAILQRLDFHGAKGDAPRPQDRPRFRARGFARAPARRSASRDAVRLPLRSSRRWPPIPRRGSQSRATRPRDSPPATPPSRERRPRWGETRWRRDRGRRFAARCCAKHGIDPVHHGCGGAKIVAATAARRNARSPMPSSASSRNARTSAWRNP